MRLGTVLLAVVVIAGVFGIAMVLVPGTIHTMFGVSTDVDGTWMTRFYGSALIGLAAFAWAARSVREPAAQRAIATGGLVAELAGTIVALALAFSPAGNAMTWLTVALYALLALGFAAVLFGNRAGMPAAAARA